MDQAVLKSLTPGQQVIKIVRDELLALFGDAEGGLRKDAPTPRVVLLLGLQGSGKDYDLRQARGVVEAAGQASAHGGPPTCGARRRSSSSPSVGEKADVKVFAPETMDPVARAAAP
jgi:signal recognition particle subunit SRP54